MAKWGEGDPRWIVEERADAVNVNNWHWTEKNATAWSKDKIKSLLEGLVIEDGDCRCSIKEVTKVEGEASANNRKAKLIFFYEWDIKAEWTGSIIGREETYKGELEIPNLSEEVDAKDIVVNITTSNSAEEADRLKQFFRISGTPIIQEQMSKYMKDLKEEFSQGMVLPSKIELGSKQPPPTKSDSGVAINNTAKQHMAQPACASVATSGVKINCRKLTDSVEFKCRGSELYRVLTEREAVQAFSRSSNIVFEPEKSGRFVLFDGNIMGEFTDLDPYKTIGMRWRAKAWPNEHYSNVTLTITEKEDHTLLQLVQTGVPEKELDKIAEGWKNYYWQSIKQTFGFGASLY